MRRAALLLIGLIAPRAGADEVYLRGGGRLSGEIVEKTPTTVVLDVGPGRIALPLSRVERIVSGRAAITTYRERASALAPGDTEGWAALATWAGDQGLQTAAGEAWQRVLRIDPGHPGANAALGHVLVGSRWMSPEEAYRAQGLVPFEGSWITPAERLALVRERQERAAAHAERALAEVRRREAEARAEAAEAEARRAEESRSASGGLPYYPWVYGGPVVVTGRPHGGRDRACESPAPRTAPAPPRTAPTPSRISGSGSTGSRMKSNPSGTARATKRG